MWPPRGRIPRETGRVTTRRLFGHLEQFVLPDTGLPLEGRQVGVQAKDHPRLVVYHVFVVRVEQQRDEDPLHAHLRLDHPQQMLAGVIGPGDDSSFLSERSASS